MTKPLTQMRSSQLNPNRTSRDGIIIVTASCYTPSERIFGTWQKGQAMGLGDKGT